MSENSAPNSAVRRRRRKGLIPAGAAAEAMFILFYSLPFWEWLFEQLFELLDHEELAVPCTLAVVYLPIVALFASSRQRVPVDFFVLMLCVGLYFAVTYCIHPEYEYYYAREQYGVLDYVLRPDNGLYAYLFVRMVNDPRRILRGLCVSGGVVYAFSLLRLYVATVKGFWMEEGSRGQEYMSSYNMNYGYTLLIFVCCYLYCALRYRKIGFLLLAGLGMFMILCGGSRGPFLDIAIFIAVYWLAGFARSRYKPLYLSGTALGAGAAAVCCGWLPELLAGVTDRLHLHSRTLAMLQSGTVAQNNGRDVFWTASFGMIRDNLLGYGAMGARHVLCDIHIVGHPHNFFIELLIEYGVVLGPLIILLLLFASFRMIVGRRGGEWQGVFLIFFANACQLLTSYTYLHSPALWGALAVGVCYYKSVRNRNAVSG